MLELLVFIGNAALAVFVAFCLSAAILDSFYKG